MSQFYSEELGIALCAIALDEDASTNNYVKNTAISHFAQSVLSVAKEILLPNNDGNNSVNSNTLLMQLLSSCGSNNSSSGGNVIRESIGKLSYRLQQEEQTINAQLEQNNIARDKLKAELTRVEAVIDKLEKRGKEIDTEKSFCRIAINGLVHYNSILSSNKADNNLFNNGRRQGDGSELSQQPQLKIEQAFGGAATQTPKNKVLTSLSLSSSSSASSLGVDGSNNIIGGKDGVNSRPFAVENADSATNSSSSSSSNNHMTKLSTSPSGSTVSVNLVDALNEVVAILSIPNGKSSAISAAVSRLLSLYNTNNIVSVPWSASTDAEIAATYKVSNALIAHLPLSLHQNTIEELLILRQIIKRTMSQPPLQPPVQSSGKSVTGGGGSTPIVDDGNYNLDDVFLSENTIKPLIKLLTSVNEDIKLGALECLNLMCPEYVCQQLIAKCGGVMPIVHIVATSTNEKVLEQALVCFWHLIFYDENIRGMVRDAGGFKSVLDLLYTDSMNILDNVCISIGYFTRDEEVKKSINEVGGLEKLTATLLHPNPLIQSKIAAALWNCSADNRNRLYLRQLGAIPMLIELLASEDESVLDNATGALWNLAVDNENKIEILQYGGITALVKLLKSSISPLSEHPGSKAGEGANSTLSFTGGVKILLPKVVENTCGTLWNCSAVSDNRPAIRNADGIPVLLSLISNVGASVKTRECAAAAIRNCSILDQNKISVRQANGIDILLRVCKEAYKLACTEKELSSDDKVDGRGIEIANNGSNPSYTFSAFSSVLEKCLAALWILTVSPENKHALRDAGGLQILLDLLKLNNNTTNLLSTPIMEKLFGVIRNYASERENRQGMLQNGAIKLILRVFCNNSSLIGIGSCSNSNISNLINNNKKILLSSLSSPVLTETNYESICGTLWNFSREDKIIPREEGALDFLCCVIINKKNLPEPVLEQAAGAISSLSMRPENREVVREYGILPFLIDVFRGNKWKSNGAILNAVLVIRNCTASNDIKNIEVVTMCEGHIEMLNLIKSRLKLMQSDTQFKSDHEDISKEACLCLKNCVAINSLTNNIGGGSNCPSATAAMQIVERQGINDLRTLIEIGGTDTKKAASMALHTLNKALSLVNSNTNNSNNSTSNVNIINNSC